MSVEHSQRIKLIFFTMTTFSALNIHVLLIQCVSVFAFHVSVFQLIFFFDLYSQAYMTSIDVHIYGSQYKYNFTAIH